MNTLRGVEVDWTQIILATISGALGGVAGAVLGGLLSPLLSFGQNSMRRFFGVIIPLLGIAGGVRYLEPFITPYLEEPISAMLSQEGKLANNEEAAHEAPYAPASDTPIRPPQVEIDAAVDKALKGFDDPVLLALIEREPDRREGIRQRFEGAYIRGRENGLHEEIDRIRIEIGTVSIPFYLARAQDKDLISAGKAMRDTIIILNEADPVTCHLWVYGSMIGQNFEYERYLAAIGETRHRALQETLAEAVRGSYEFVPDYDEALAVQRLAEIGQDIYKLLGDEKIGLIISAQEPEGIEDSRLACDATAEFYSAVLASEDAASVLRRMFMTGPGGY